MTTPHRAVIIGNTARGAFGHHLDRAFDLVPGVEVAAIADPDNAGLKTATERSKAKRGYADYREMLMKEKPTLAVVAQRWCDERDQIVADCVAAGVRGIYLEKPIAQTPAQTDAMIAACDKAGVRVAVDHWRVSGEVQKAWELVQGGAIGKLQVLRGHGKADARAGGLDTMVLGTHILDAMLRLAGADPVWVQGHVMQQGREVVPSDAVEGAEGIGLVAGDSITAEYAFSNGVIGQYESMVADKTPGSPGGSYFGMEIQGSKGILSIRQRSVQKYSHGLWTANAGQWESMPLDGWESMAIEPYYVACHEICINELIRAIAEDRPLDPRVSSLTDGAWAIEMISGIHQSHLAARRLKFPLENRASAYA